MAVYFVYRCSYLGPTARHLCRFEDATVLDWFRRVWRGIPDHETANAYAAEVLGTRVYSFGSIFVDIHERTAAPPGDIEAVRVVLGSTYHNAIRHEEHCVQVLTDDDCCDMAYYFFDDDFVAEHGDLTAFLLHEGPLPGGCGAGGWRSNAPAVEAREPAIEAGGQGRTYSSLQVPSDDSWHTDLNADDVDLLDGMRVPDLCQQLLVRPQEEVDRLGFPFPDLRQALSELPAVTAGEERAFLEALVADPEDKFTWRVYADWLADQGHRPPGVHLLERAVIRVTGGWPIEESRCVIEVGEHAVWVCFLAEAGAFEQWFAFDDLWASANAVLANGLVRYATRRDALSTGKGTGYHQV